MRGWCFILAVLSTISVFAKQTPKSSNQLEIGLREGLSGLTYKSDYGKLTPGNNTGLDIAYRYESSNVVGLRLGVSFDFSCSYLRNKNYADGYSTTNVQNSPIDVNYTTDFKEAHLQTLLSAPVQIGIFLGDFSIFVGPKVWMNLSADYKQTLNMAKLSVYYPEYDVTIHEGKVYDAGMQTNIAHGKIRDPQKWWAGVSAEFNYLFRSPYRNYGIAVGAYMDFACNTHKVTATDALSMLSITDTRNGVPATRVQESALSTNNHHDGRQMVDRYGYFNCGVKVSFVLINSFTRSCQICKMQHQF